MDFGAIGFALVIVAFIVVNAWNWNTAREVCARAGAGETRAVDAEQIRECAEDVLGK